MKQLLLSTIILIALISTQIAAASGEGECFAVVVGKNASASGYVIMGHNEDDSGPQVVNHHKIGRQMYQPGETITLLNGGQVEQPEQTWAYIWSEMPGMRFSDAYVNEWGVAVASDACASREDNPDLTDGGISYMLRRLVAERATTSREGVRIAAELVEGFGYDAAGRTYIICDPGEGWLFCAIYGKRWLAARVPDDEVAIIANTYSVHDIDLADTANFLGSPDIIDYAVSRGWYDATDGGSFDFATAYADPGRARDSANICRQWGGLRHVAAEPVPLGTDLPCSVKPREKLDIFDVMGILRDHYEDTDLYQADPGTGCPHKTGPRNICAQTTRNSVVMQYRDDEIPLGPVIYWISLGRPCSSPYIPFYFAIDEFPPGYATRHEEPPKGLFEKMVNSPFTLNKNQAFWTFSNFDEKISRGYPLVIADLKKAIDKIERQALAEQAALEAEMKALLSPESSQNDPPEVTAEKYHAKLIGYSTAIYKSAMKTMARTHSKLGRDGR